MRKSIEGFEGLYEISDAGEVFRVAGGKGSRRGRPLKLKKDSGGYPCINLYRNKTQYFFTIHRLVAKAFVDNPLGLSEVNHIVPNKENNNAKNLEWVTRSKNITHAYDNGCFDDTSCKRKPVIGISLFDDKIVEYQSTHEAERNGFDQGQVSSCANGKLKTHKGYKWYFKTVRRVRDCVFDNHLESKSGNLEWWKEAK